MVPTYVLMVDRLFFAGVPFWWLTAHYNFFERFPTQNFPQQEVPIMVLPRNPKESPPFSVYSAASASTPPCCRSTFVIIAAVCLLLGRGNGLGFDEGRGLAASIGLDGVESSHLVFLQRHGRRGERRVVDLVA